MTIIFLERSNSPYLVHCDKYIAKKAQDLSLEKNQTCSQRSLLLISFFFASLKESAQSTLGNAATSFKYMVLGYHGSPDKFQLPNSMGLAAFKVIFWGASMGWGLSATTLRLFMEKTSSGHSLLLKEFASDGINVEHIKTEELELDASIVPKNITVNNLENILDAINFTDSQGPGYMPPTTRKENNHTFTQEELKRHLQNFIRRVNTRKAFLGTPPGYDIPRLMDFYQQIEDAVRLSIQKATSDVEEFERVNGTNYYGFDLKKKREYNRSLSKLINIVPGYKFQRLD